MKPRLEPLDHGFGRSRGGLSTKVHQLVDGRGLPLVTLITPGQAGDSPMLLPLLAELRVTRPFGRPRTRPDRVRGDKAYSSRAIRRYLRNRGIEAVIPEPRDQQGHRVSRRQARVLRPGRLQEPERHRARLLPIEAMAGTRDQVRQARDCLPRRGRPQCRGRVGSPPERHHPLMRTVSSFATMPSSDVMRSRSSACSVPSAVCGSRHRSGS